MPGVLSEDTVVGGPIAKVVLHDGRIFRVGATRPIKLGENYLHLRYVHTTIGPLVVFGVDTWLSEGETRDPGLVLVEEKSN